MKSALVVVDITSGILMASVRPSKLLPGKQMSGLVILEDFAIVRTHSLHCQCRFQCPLNLIMFRVLLEDVFVKWSAMPELGDPLTLPESKYQ